MKTLLILFISLISLNSLHSQTEEDYFNYLEGYYNAFSQKNIEDILNYFPKNNITFGTKKGLKKDDLRKFLNTTLKNVQNATYNLDRSSLLVEGKEIKTISINCNSYFSITNKNEIENKSSSSIEIFKINKEMQIVSYTYKEMPIKEINWILVEGGPRGDFNISETEVTFAQFDKFCEETGYDKPIDEGWVRGNRPVINVNVEDANKFCEWLSEKTGRVIRLPEEDEWEFAARGGNKSNGYEYSGSDNLDNVGWYDDNSGNKTHEVGTKKPNELGIYDMSGNVWEWAGTEGDIRGGSWADFSHNCSVSSRSALNPANRDNALGFRVLQNSR